MTVCLLWPSIVKVIGCNGGAAVSFVYTYLHADLQAGQEAMRYVSHM
jgi:hypothetical protein